MGQSQQRRKPGTGSIYKDGNRYKASISLGRGPDGKRRRAWVTGATETEVAKKLAERKKLRDESRPQPNGRMTLAGALEKFYDAEVLGRDLAVKTVEGYEREIRIHIVPALGYRRLIDVTPNDIWEFLECKHKAQYSTSVIKSLLRTLRQAYRFAMRWGWATFNPAELVDAPKGTKKEIRPLNQEQLASFLVAAGNHRLYAAFYLQVALGLRNGELLGLTWNNANLESRTVFIEQALKQNKGKKSLGSLKTERSRRTLRIGSAAPVLNQHLLQQNRDQFDAGSHWLGNPDGLIFTTAVGTPIDSHNYRREFRKVCKEAELSGFAPHCLRHTFVSLLASSADGPSIEVIADLVGHASSRTTETVYRHQIRPRVEEASVEIDRYLRRSG